MNQMVSFKDYDGLSGFGISSQTEVDDLNKALTTGYGVGTGATTVGGVLRIESLEATLRVVTFTLQNIKFWKKIPKLPAFSTVEEYNILSDYGNDTGPFTPEGTLPEAQDNTYARKTAKVKYLGTTRAVSHPASLVRPAHGNVIALETQNGAVWLVEKIERYLFNGREDTNAYAWDGMDRQILDGIGLTSPWGSTDPSTYPILIDCRGSDNQPGDLSEDLLEKGANAVVEQYGVPTDLFLTPRALSQVGKQFFPRERVNLPAPQNGKVGLAVESFQSSAGLIEFNSDIFLRPGRSGAVKTAPAAATHTSAPSAPTLGAATSAGSGSRFTAADVGNFYWRVTAFNRYGESVPADTAATAVVAGQYNPITITDTSSGAATGFRIYRTKTPGAALATAELMMEVPNTAPALTNLRDYNWYLPGASRSYLFQNNMANYSFRQLAPMMKIPLATIDPSIRWMQLLYGVPILYTPKKNVIFYNLRDV